MSEEQLLAIENAMKGALERQQLQFDEKVAKLMAVINSLDIKTPDIKTYQENKIGPRAEPECKRPLTLPDLKREAIINPVLLNKDHIIIWETLRANQGF